MGDVARCVAAVIAALLAYFVIFNVLIGIGVFMSGTSQSLTMFALSFGVFGGILVGTTIVPQHHRRVALWLFIGLMCLTPLGWFLWSLARGGEVGWLDIAGTLSGVIFAPMFARFAIKGCEAQTTYPLSIAHPWIEKGQ